MIFGLSVSIVYLDVTNRIPSQFAAIVMSMQIIPSLLSIVSGAGIVAVGALIVLVSTVLFGRMYCSTVCPLGTYQDLILRLSEKYRHRRLLRYSKRLYGIHYGLFAVMLVGFLFGSVSLLNLFEPFSNYGRMLNTLIAPILVSVNNVAASLLIESNIFLLYDIPHAPVSIAVILVVLSFFGLVTYLSYYHGRLFCNALCPAGALLGLLSRISLFKLVLNESSCTHCKLCEKVCKAQCIDSTEMKLDFSACVGCFNCVDVCHTEGVTFEYRYRSAPGIKPVPVVDSRRIFLRSTALPAMAAFVPFSDSLSAPASEYSEAKTHPVSPPGSVTIHHFSSACTACQLCVSFCPTHVLQPALLGYGLSGILQPRMDFTHSFCNYDCTVCGAVCPTGAILPLAPEDKKRTQIGKAKFIKDDCIVITKKKDCGACSEHCPTKAVKMVPHEGVFLPEVNDEICIGCGACEHACPTVPRKAIFVESNAVHARAKEPEKNRQTARQEVLEEFPF